MPVCDRSVISFFLVKMEIKRIEIPNLGISKDFGKVTWLTEDENRDIIIDAVKRSISFVFSNDRRTCEENFHSVAAGAGPSMMMDKIGEEELNKYGGIVDINVSADFAGNGLNWRIYKKPSKNKSYPEFSKYKDALKFLSEQFESGYDYPVLKVYNNGFPNTDIERHKRFISYRLEQIITNGNSLPLRNCGYFWWNDGESNTMFWEIRLYTAISLNLTIKTGIPISIIIFDVDRVKELPILKEESIITERIDKFLRIIGSPLKTLYLECDVDRKNGHGISGICVEDRDGTWLKYDIIDLPGDGLGKSIYLVMDLTYRELFLSCRDCDERKKSGGIVVLEDFLVDLHPERRKKIIESITKIFSNIQFIIK